MSNSGLIAKLLKAEEEAESIVAAARDNRVKALRDARTAALEEIDQYKAKEEEAYNQKLAAMNTGNTDADKKSIQQELVQVQKDADRNKESIQQELVQVQKDAD